MKPFRIERPDTCPNCKSQRSLEAYTKYDRPIKLSLRIDRDNQFDGNIYYMKCSKCGYEYFPKWLSLSKFPFPMHDSDYENFMNSYILSFRKAESK